MTTKENISSQLVLYCPIARNIPVVTVYPLVEVSLGLEQVQLEYCFLSFLR
ncbi:hypothetical protein [Paenibacillus psychroresistens]|uniref:hypothetical protein n=1 Tax=Paenibacillus psychroresistens TaxID=1778678 RepID=UPI0012DA58B9|nr:hypothetical protein [Paenibacillus psychroresistens]